MDIYHPIATLKNHMVFITPHTNATKRDFTTRTYTPHETIAALTGVPANSRDIYILVSLKSKPGFALPISNFRKEHSGF